MCQNRARRCPAPQTHAPTSVVDAFPWRAEPPLSWRSLLTPDPAPTPDSKLQKRKTWLTHFCMGVIRVPLKAFLGWGGKACGPARYEGQWGERLRTCPDPLATTNESLVTLAEVVRSQPVGAAGAPSSSRVGATGSVFPFPNLCLAESSSRWSLLILLLTLGGIRNRTPDFIQ